MVPNLLIHLRVFGVEMKLHGNINERLKVAYISSIVLLQTIVCFQVAKLRPILEAEMIPIKC